MPPRIQSAPAQPPRDLAYPAWLCEPLHDRTVLLNGRGSAVEQGMLPGLGTERGNDGCLQLRIGERIAALQNCQAVASEIALLVLFVSNLPILAGSEHDLLHQVRLPLRIHAAWPIGARNCRWACCICGVATMKRARAALGGTPSRRPQDGYWSRSGSSRRSR